MNSAEKTRLVRRLLDIELKGTRAGREAGRECAMKYLTMRGFEAIVALDEPKFATLRATLRNKGEKKWHTDLFWRELVGSDFEKVVACPGFTRAFVESVREVWEQVRDEVLAEVEDRPDTVEEDNIPGPVPAANAPSRPPRRGPGPRPGARRRGTWRR